MTLGPGAFQYPAPDAVDDPYYGVIPVDFIMESILLDGLDWFRNDPEAKNFVFGHLLAMGKYGQAKVNEISSYINKYEIAVVQSFALVQTDVPSISIQLLDGGEKLEWAGLNDHQRAFNELDGQDNFLGRYEEGYCAIADTVQLGIHSINTPDFAKYLYYLVVYILNVRKSELEAMNIILGTFRATDLSRLNDYLPENMYSRFINFSVSSLMRFRKGQIPVLDTIRGVHVTDPDSDIENIDLGLSVRDIKQSNNGGGNG